MTEKTSQRVTPTAAELRPLVQEMMDAAWREPGFCVPNQATYPHQWLWDSCFHAIVWAALGSDRAVTEITSLLAKQGADGFVPHMIYWTAPELHADFWGRSGVSSITQPPMYGHAIAEVLRAGFAVPAETVARAARGLLHLGDRRRTATGLIPVFHPWETGCDDSARWDGWLVDGVARADRVALWRERKGALVASLELGAEGQAIGNPEFNVGSIGFNALVAWNACELVDVAGPFSERLTELSEELTTRIAGRWDGDRWVDDGPPSGRTRTLDAMAALLVDPRERALDDLIDPEAFGAPFGPAGVHRGELSYDPQTYWRGPAWPQLNYLMMVAAERAGADAVAETLAKQTAAGASASGFAEFWNPETSTGLGAMPQSWAGLGLVAAARLG